MKINNCILLFLLALFVFACKGKTNMEKVTFTEKDTIKGCEITNNFLNGVTQLEQNVKLFNIKYSSMDNCYLAFLDSLYNHFILESNTRYLECLDLIAYESDGYISEYLPELSGRIFAAKPKVLIDFFYSKRADSSRGTVTFFVEYLSKLIKDSNNKKQIIADLKMMISDYEFSVEEKEYYYFLISSASQKLD
ncbi:MAG: hypothetical protein K8I03_07295 [Ignavibacteria bacterium]|nr:hypothetical protein [Ignavibacteria bacterium]